MMSARKQNGNWGGKCHVLYGSQGKEPEQGIVEQISQGRLLQAQGKCKEKGSPT